MTTEHIEPLTQEQEDAIIAEMRAGKEAAVKAAEASIPAEVVKTPTAASERRFRAHCAACGEPFDALEMKCGFFTLSTQACPPCVEKRIQDTESRGKTIIENSSLWAIFCPEPAFRTQAEGGSTVVARLQRDCLKYDAIMAHQFGPQGLLLRGDTGKCKTRAMWRLMRKLFDEGKSIAAVTSGKFQREYQSSAGKHEANEWFDRLARADCFFLDDLGRVPWTPNTWGQFFELIDDRCKNERPFFITTNETGDSLAQMCADPVTWSPLYRRLKENCASLVL